MTQSTDTNPEVERIYVSLLRNISVHDRLVRTLSFSSSIIDLSKRAISRANPDLSEQEKNILFVEYHYGVELAKKLRSFLNES